MADVKMVVVDGVRYRPEDAPHGATTEEKAAPAPKNKARKPTNKSADATDEK